IRLGECPRLAAHHAASGAVGAHGTKVDVTGDSAGSTSGPDYTTLAYDALTGARDCVKFYNGPSNDTDRATSLAISPDGTKVFVTGGSAGSTSSDYATIAYVA